MDEITRIGIAEAHSGKNEHLLPSVEAVPRG